MDPNLANQSDQIDLRKDAPSYHDCLVRVNEFLAWLGLWPTQKLSVISDLVTLALLSPEKNTILDMVGNLSRGFLELNTCLLYTSDAADE